MLFILLNYLSQEDVKESKHLEETLKFLSPTIPKFKNHFKTDFPYTNHSNFYETFQLTISQGSKNSCWTAPRISCVRVCTCVCVLNQAHSLEQRFTVGDRESGIKTA